MRCVLSFCIVYLQILNQINGFSLRNRKETNSLSLFDTALVWLVSSILVIFGKHAHILEQWLGCKRGKLPNLRNLTLQSLVALKSLSQISCTATYSHECLPKPTLLIWKEALIELTEGTFTLGHFIIQQSPSSPRNET